MKKKPIENRYEKEVEKTKSGLVEGVGSGSLPGVPFDYPKDSLTEDKLIKDKLIKDKLIKGEVLKGKPRRILTRLGRASGPERINCLRQGSAPGL